MKRFFPLVLIIFGAALLPAQDYELKGLKGEMKTTGPTIFTAVA